MLNKTQEVDFLPGPEERHFLLIALPETAWELNDLNPLRTCKLKEWGKGWCTVGIVWPHRHCCPWLILWGLTVLPYRSRWGCWRFFVSIPGHRGVCRWGPVVLHLYWSRLQGGPWVHWWLHISLNSGQRPEWELRWGDVLQTHQWLGVNRKLCTKTAQP